MPKRGTSKRHRRPARRRVEHRRPNSWRRTLTTGAALLLGSAILAAVMLPSRLGGEDSIDSSVAAGRLPGDPLVQGQGLFTTYCMACHGVNGVGERPDDIYAVDSYGYVAPPLDDTGHAWHHTDDQLIRTIMEGSPRNSRMVAWEHLLTADEALSIVSYVKSLWSPFIRDNCQGPAHMNPRC